MIKKKAINIIINNIYMKYGIIKEKYRDHSC